MQTLHNPVHTESLLGQVASWKGEVSMVTRGGCQGEGHSMLEARLSFKVKVRGVVTSATYSS